MQNLLDISQREKEWPGDRKSEKEIEGMGKIERKKNIDGHTAMEKSFEIREDKKNGEIKKKRPNECHRIQ